MSSKLHELFVECHWGLYPILEHNHWKNLWPQLHEHDAKRHHNQRVRHNTIELDVKHEGKTRRKSKIRKEKEKQHAKKWMLKFQ